MSDPVITFTIPDKKQKGYLRRLLPITELQEQFQAQKAGGTVSSSMIRKMIEVFSQYVTVDPPVIPPEEALMDLSEEDFEKFFEAFQGGDPKNPLPPGSDAPSADGPSVNQA